jgi:cysteine protease ATG4
MDIDSDDQEGGDGEQFFDTRSGSASTSSASQHEMDEAGKSEADSEEDPVDPITPGPGSRFEIGGPERKGAEEENTSINGEFDAEVDTFDDDNIEDDWVDPSVPTPTQQAPLPPPPVPEKQDLPILVPVDVPILAKSKSGGGKKGKKGKKGAQIAVPVPLVKSSSLSLQQQPQEHYPFPLTQRSVEEMTPEPLDRPRRASNMGPGGKRMHTTRARDGGRTQSGGVKGVLTEA